MLPAPAPVVVVHADYGGQIVDFAARVSDYLKRRVTVRLEGDCISACTMVTAIPSKRICVGSDASLQFHQSYLMNRFDPLDTTIRSDEGTALMMRFYPKRIRDWIASKGGLTSDLITLKGEALRRLFRVCKASPRP